jgi:hypothetical protein
VKVVKLLFKHINICFFGGDSRTETVRKRDPEPQELIDLRNRIDDMLAPLTEALNLMVGMRLISARV